MEMLDEDLAQTPSARCVLVAEDDEVMREDIAWVLRQDGYTVVELKNGAELATYLEECRTRGGTRLAPDLIVSDIRMPGHSGLDVLDALRHLYWAVPVILMTGFGDSKTHVEAQRLGATAVFDKPFDIDDLRTVVFWAAPLYR